MILISEYQNKSRNARVYKTDRGDYHIIMYDADYDYNGFHAFMNLDNAEDYAESWVLQQ
jgi:hypothetical protein